MKASEVKEQLGVKDLYVIRTAEGRPIMFDEVLQPNRKEFVFGDIDLAKKIVEEYKKLGENFIVCKVIDNEHCVQIELLEPEESDA